MYRLLGSKYYTGVRLKELVHCKKRYVETFAGSGRTALSLLTDSRFKYTTIILNDIDPAVVNFWECVKYHNKKLRSEIAHLIGRFDLDPDRKKWYNEVRGQIRNPEYFTDPVAQAATTYMVAAYGWLGTLQMENYRRDTWNTNRKLFSALKKMAGLEDHMARVELSNVDYTECISSW